MSQNLLISSFSGKYKVKFQSADLFSHVLEHKKINFSYHKIPVETFLKEICANQIKQYMVWEMRL